MTRQGSFSRKKFSHVAAVIVGAVIIAEKLGVEVTLQETHWDAIFVESQSGRFDITAN